MNRIARILFFFGALFLSNFASGQVYISDSAGLSMGASVSYCSESQSIFAVTTTSGYYRSLDWTANSGAITILKNYNNDSSKVLVQWGTIPASLQFILFVNDTLNGFSDSISVNAFNLPSVTLNNPWSSVVTCLGNDTVVSGGSPSGGTYTIDGYPGAISNDTILDISSLLIGAYNLVYTYTDSNGCTNSATQNISVDGITLIGGNTNMFVSEIYGSTSSLLLPTQYLNNITYPACSQLSATTFGLSFTSALNHLTGASLTIDWGDGAQTSTVLAVGNSYDHFYAASGVYPVTVNVSDSTGCSITSNFNLYFGSTQVLGLSTPGNTSLCFEPYQDSVYFDFTILNWEQDPSSTYYQFSCNDSSTAKVAYSPLVVNGAGIHPWLIFNPVDSTLSYRHWFEFSSCGFNTILGGQSYDNVFAITATKQSPCIGSQSTAAVGPIVVSQSPEAPLNGDTIACLNEYVTVFDSIYNGSNIIPTTDGNFICDTSFTRVWLVYDESGNPLTPGPTTFTLGAGSSLGDTNISSSLPSYWTGGSYILSLAFHQTGTYRVRKLHGFSGTGSALACAVDTPSHWICVDTLSGMTITQYIPDTVCLDSQYEVVFQHESSLCFDSLTYQVKISSLDGTIVDTSFTDKLSSKFITMTSTGTYTIEYLSPNPCGINSIIDTFVVIAEPNYLFNADSEICSDTLILTVGQGPLDIGIIDPYRPIDSTYYTITPSSGWRYLGLDSNGFDIFAFDSVGTFEVVYEFHNQCGYNIDTLKITNYDLPNSDFSLSLNPDCGKLYFSASALDLSGINSDNWSLFSDSGSVQEWTDSSITSFDDSLSSTSIYGLSWYKLQHISVSPFGCRDTTEKFFFVAPTPIVSFTLDTSSCDIWSPSIMNSSQGDSLTYSWSITAIGNSFSLDSISGLTDSVPYLLFNPLRYPLQDESYLLKLTGYGPDSCDYVSIDTIVILSKPLSQFNLVDTICSNQWYPLYDSSMSYHQISSFRWSSLDTSVSFSDTAAQNTSFNVNQVNDSIQEIVIKLTIMGEFGCEDYSYDTLYALPSPLLLIAMDSIACDSSELNLIGLNLTNPVNFGDSITFTWAVTNSLIGTTDTLYGQLPNYVFTNDTTFAIPYYIWVEALNTPGCNDIYLDTVLIHPDVEVAITTTNGFCSPLTIDTSLVSVFVNQSATNHYAWITDLDGDTLYEGSNLNYLLSTAGDTIIITYEISSDWGCSSDRDSVLIFTVNQGNPISYPEAIYETNQGCYTDTVCVGDTVQFYSTSIAPTNGSLITILNWDFGNNGIVDATGDTISFVFSLPGWNSILLEAQTQSGCDDDTLGQIYVIAAPQVIVDLIDNSICAPAVPDYTHSDIGFYDSLRFDLYLLSDTGSMILIQSWTSAPTLPMLNPSYDMDDVYVLRKTLLSCCQSIYDQDTIILKTPPVANFYALPDVGCSNLDVSLVLDGQITGEADSAYIDWGDGNANGWMQQLVPGPNGFELSWQQPLHNFTYTGTGDTTYTITLSVFNECGDSSITKDVTLTSGSISAAFIASDLTGCEPLTVTFTSLAFNYDNIGWCLDYDPITKTCDSAVSISPNPQYTYDTNGTYYVAHFASNECGTDTTVQVIDVYPNVAADFQSNNFVCGNDTVYFNNTSYSNNGVIIGYKWMFGDGDSSFTTNAAHVFDTGGVYSVTLYTYSTTGCVSSITKDITIHPTPDVSITGGAVCLGDTSIFTNITSVSGGTIAGILWDFGDSNTSALSSPSHLYQFDGFYTVTLKVTSDFGCIDTAKTFVLVNPNPVSAFTAVMIQGDSCNVPQTYDFINSTQYGVSFEWDFDAASFPGIYTSTLNSPTFTFTKARNYTVSLISETAFGCIDSTSRQIQVNGSLGIPPAISQSGCIPLSVGYVDTSAVSNGVDSIVQVVWSMGDGTTFANFSPPFGYSYVYNLPGTYSVYATVTTANGCVTQNAPVLMFATQNPIAQFSNDTNGVLGMYFENLSLPIDSSYEYYWTFSDGQQSFDISPTMIFDPSLSALDSMEICLLVTSPDNCIDSICKRIWVWQSSLFVPNAMAPEQVFSNDDQYFLPKGFGLAAYELRIYDKWGNEVFFSDSISSTYYSPAVGWDGNDQRTGKPAPMGVYAWNIRATFRDGTRWTGHLNTNGRRLTYGTLTLLR